MTLRRFGLWSAIVLFLLAVLAAGVLFVASRSETVLRWGVETFASRLPCRLTLDGLHGAITEPLHVERLSCENDAYRIEAQDVTLDWSPWQLTRRQLDISMLRAASLAYRQKQSEAAATSSPDNLALPLPVRIDAIEIDALRIERATAAPLLVGGLRAAYAGDAHSHRLTLRSLASEWGSLQGEATLGAQAPLPLQARLRVDSARVEGWPIAASVELSGPLARLAAKVDGSAAAVTFSAQAELALFEDEPVKALSAHSDRVNLKAIDPRLPETALAVQINAQVQEMKALSGEISLDNPQPAPIDRNGLPLRKLSSKFRASLDALELQDATFDLGAAGEAAGSASYRDGLLRLDVDVSALNLRLLQSSLRATKLAGNLRIEGDAARQRVAARLREKELSFEGEASIANRRVTIERLLARTGGAEAKVSGDVVLDEATSFLLNVTLRRFDPARFGDFPEADINGTVQAQGVFRPQWRARLDYRLARSRFRGQSLGGSGKLGISPGRMHDADFRLTLGENGLTLNGGFGAAGDTLRFDLRAPKLDMLDAGVRGSLQASGTLAGTPSRPALDARFQAAKIVYGNYRVERWNGEARLEQGDDPKLALRWLVEGAQRGKRTLDRVSVAAEGSLSAHRIDFTARGGYIDATAHLEGGFDRNSKTWRGRLTRLENAGEYAFTMMQPTALELAQQRVSFTATRVRFSNTEIVLGDTAYRDGALTTSGSVGGVRLSRLLALMDKPPKLESTLVLAARWSLRAADTLDGSLELERESGDIVIPGEEALVMGLTKTTFSVGAVANRLDARVSVSGTRFNVQGGAQTVAQRREVGWGIAGRAPLKLDLNAEWQSIRPLFALFAGDALSGDGSLALSIKADGTVAEPRVSGTLAGDKLKFEQIANGVFLRDGVLRAQFGEKKISVSEFRIRGGDGSFSAKGSLATREGKPQVDLSWSAQKLQAVQHPDLRLTLSGAGTLKADDKQLALSGELTADRGRVDLRSQTAPTLGSDVVVAGREKRVSVTERALKAVLDLKLDLGPDFRITGRGLEARLAGNLRLTSPGDAPLTAKGEIRIVEGSYVAYNRRLDIDEGQFFFTGPVDNPGLLIRALRKNQSVEAGVEVTGTARDPRVQLVSVPEVPDPEKLSWLVLGRQLESGSTQDAQALQSSAVALAAGLGTSPLQQQLASAVGLDELRFGLSGGETQSGVVTIGKRVSDKIYVSSEQSLSTATNTLRVSYQLSQRWSVRTESGVTDAVDLFFTISFD